MNQDTNKTVSVVRSAYSFFLSMLKELIKIITLFGIFAVIGGAFGLGFAHMFKVGNYLDGRIIVISTIPAEMVQEEEETVEKTDITLKECDVICYEGEFDGFCSSCPSEEVMVGGFL